MKPINEQINADFVKQAQKLSQYKHLLSGILPIECRNHVEVANFRNQNLMLITDSPVWTTRLRQLSPQLLDFIRKNTQEADELHSIHHIQISTRYHTSANSPAQSSTNKKHSLLSISDKTSELLLQSANSIDHPKLKNALLKIARHNKHKQPTEK